MDVAIAIMFLVASAWIVQFLVRFLGGEGHTEIGFWNALATLLLCSYAAKGVIWLLPKMDGPPRIAVSFGIYLLAMVAMLMLYCKVRPARALLISLIVAVTMIVRSVLLVLSMDK